MSTVTGISCFALQAHSPSTRISLRHSFIQVSHLPLRHHCLHSPHAFSLLINIQPSAFLSASLQPALCPEHFTSGVSLIFHFKADIITSLALPLHALALAVHCLPAAAALPPLNARRRRRFSCISRRPPFQPAVSNTAVQPSRSSLGIILSAAIAAHRLGRISAHQPPSYRRSSSRGSPLPPLPAFSLQPIRPQFSSLQ